MPATALALALIAAVVHAVWNTLLARSRDPEAATALVLLSGSVVGLPIAAAWWGLDARVWPFLVVSTVLEAGYLALLGVSYRRAELSVVYPLARGLAPVLVLLAAVAFTGASASAGEVVGVLLVAGGVLLVRGLRRGDSTGALFGLAIAVLIAGYTVVDKHGLRYATPGTYLAIMTFGMALAYVPFAAFRRGTAAIRDEVSGRTLIAGVGMCGGYLLVLAALRLAPAASVSAVRESSVLIATALAALFLREHVTRWRFAGAALVVGGVALLSLF
jgi:drug/metabolite transporter (DMT)-like permease